MIALDVPCMLQGVQNMIIFCLVLVLKVFPLVANWITHWKYFAKGLISGAVHTSYTFTFTLIIKPEKIRFPYDLAFHFNLFTDYSYIIYIYLNFQSDQQAA